MATNADTIPPGTPLGLGRLFVAVPIAAPLASLAASLALSGLLMSEPPGEFAGEALLGALLIGGMSAVVSLPFVLGGLLLIALPLTIVMVRFGVATRARNVIGLAIAAAIAGLLWLVFDWSPNDPQTGPGALFALYAVVSAIVWVAVVSWLERRSAAKQEAGEP